MRPAAARDLALFLAPTVLLALACKLNHGRVDDRPGIGRTSAVCLIIGRSVNSWAPVSRALRALPGTSATAVGLDKIAEKGVFYEGLSVLGGGSILGGLVLGAVGVFIIDRKFTKAAAFALVGAALTFLGFMHGEAIGFGESPVVALGYLSVSAILFACAKYASTVPLPAGHHEEESPHGTLPVPAPAAE